MIQGRKLLRISLVPGHSWIKMSCAENQLNVASFWKCSRFWNAYWLKELQSKRLKTRNSSFIRKVSVPDLFSLLFRIWVTTANKHISMLQRTQKSIYQDPRLSTEYLIWCKILITFVFVWQDLAFFKRFLSVGLNLNSLQVSCQIRSGDGELLLPFTFTFHHYWCHWRITKTAYKGYN